MATINPRQCFKASRSAYNLQEKKLFVEGDIRTAATDDPKNFSQLLYDTRMTNCKASHKIFDLRPGPTWSLALCGRGPVSIWVVYTLLAHYKSIKEERAR